MLDTLFFPQRVLQVVRRHVYVLKMSGFVVPQVFGEGVDSVKKSLEGIFDDTVPDGKVKHQLSSCLLPPSFADSLNAVLTLRQRGDVEPPGEERTLCALQSL